MPASRRALVVLVAAALLGAGPSARPRPAASLTVYPGAIDLVGPRAEQHVGVLATFADKSQADLSGSATFKVGSEKVAVVEKGVLRPVGDGTTTLTVEAGGKSASVAVRVKGIAADTPVSFSREVSAVLRPIVAMVTRNVYLRPMRSPM